MPPRLRCRLLPGFTQGELLHSPRVTRDQPGLRLAVDQLHHAPGLVRFRLLVACGFPNDYHASFHHLTDALIVVVRDLGAGATAAFRLQDPSVTPLVEPGPAFVDRRGPVPSILFASSFCNARLEVDLPPGPPPPGLLVHLALHEHLSNVVCVPTAPEPTR